MVDKYELLKMARNYLNNVTKEQLKKDIEECWVEAGPPLCNCNCNYIRDPEITDLKHWMNLNLLLILNRNVIKFSGQIQLKGNLHFLIT